MQIPDDVMIDAAPIDEKLKERIRKSQEGMAKAQAKQAEQDRQMQAVTAALLNAQKFQSLATGKEKLARIQEDRSQAAYDQARAIKEIDKIEAENFVKYFGVLKEMMDNGAVQPQSQPVPPMGGTPEQF